MSREQLVTDLFLQIEHVNLSDNVRALRLFRDPGQRETTGLSEARVRTFVRDYSTGLLQVEWYADFANNSVMRTLDDLHGQEAFVQCNPYTRGRSASKPRYQFNVLVTGLDVMNLRHGLVSTFQTSFPITGEVGKTPSAYFLTRMTCGLTNVGGDIVLGFSRTGPLGSINDQVVSRLVVPGSPPGNLDIRQITYNRTDRDLDLIFTDAADAVAVAGHWLVAGPVVFHMTGSPNITNGWRLRNVDDPGWVEFERVKIELWDEDPES